MLASSPASMVNQKRLDLGIPNRFKVASSRFRLVDWWAGFWRSIESSRGFSTSVRSAAARRGLEREPCSGGHEPVAHHDLSELRLIRLAGRIDQFGHFLEIAPSDPSRRQCCQRAGGDLAQVLVMMNASTRDKDGG